MKASQVAAVKKKLEAHVAQPQSPLVPPVEEKPGARPVQAAGDPGWGLVTAVTWYLHTQLCFKSLVAACPGLAMA